jgi:hypothetical protein
MSIKILSIFLTSALLSTPLFAEPKAKVEAPAKVEVPAKVETPAKVIHKKIETHNTMVIQEGRGDRYTEKKSFCGKDKKEANELCKEWLAEQKKSLGDKVLTSSCGQARHLMGKEDEGCNSYLSHGDITYLIK